VRAGSKADLAASSLSKTMTYQVEDLLVDADLFRRLRVRGESRGPTASTTSDKHRSW
jgi:hypothetical protein